jgi:hypothetical protein
MTCPERTQPSLVLRPPFGDASKPRLRRARWRCVGRCINGGDRDPADAPRGAPSRTAGRKPASPRRGTLRRGAGRPHDACGVASQSCPYAVAFLEAGVTASTCRRRRWVLALSWAPGAGRAGRVVQADRSLRMVDTTPGKRCHPSLVQHVMSNDRPRKRDGIARQASSVAAGLRIARGM